MNGRLVKLGLLCCCVVSLTSCDVEDDGTVAKSEAPIIFGDEVTGITPMVKVSTVFGECSGVLMGPSHVLTAGHCFVDPDGVKHPSIDVIWGTQTREVLTSETLFDPKTTDSDVAVLTLKSAFSPALVPPFLLWDGSESLVGSKVECFGFGMATDAGGAGVLRSAILTVKAELSTVPRGIVLLENSLGQRLASGDSGGVCFGKDGPTRRIVGVVRNRSTADNAGVLQPVAPVASWIIGTAWRKDVLAFPTIFTVTPAPQQWRTAQLNSTPGRELVGLTASTATVISGTVSGTGVLSLSGSSATLPPLSASWSAPEAAFTDLTGDGLSDLVVPTTSSLWVLPSTTTGFGAAVENKFALSGWTVADVSYGDIDGVGGTDYVWTGDSAVWAALSTTTGSLGVPSKRLPWSAVGAARSVAQLDLTPGADAVQVRNADLGMYSALGGGAFSSSEVTSLFEAGSAWYDYAAFAKVNADAPKDLVSARGQDLIVKMNVAGHFGPMLTTPVEFGNWEGRTLFADVNGDGSLDWVGFDDERVFFRRGNGLGGFERIIGQPHLLLKPTLEQVDFQDVDGDGCLDLVAFDQPVKGQVTVRRCSATTASPLFPPGDADATWDWGDFVSSLVPLFDWSGRPAGLGLCELIGCALDPALSSSKSTAGGAVLGTLERTSGGLMLHVAGDGLRREGTWRWTPDFELTGAANVVGDARSELLFAGPTGLVIASRDAGRLSLVHALGWGNALGPLTLSPGARFTNAHDLDGDGHDELLVQTEAGAVAVRVAPTGLEAVWATQGAEAGRAADASLARGEQRVFGPFAGRGGSSVRAVMTGAGDADLYLRLNGAPTASLWNCRPYTSSSNESCVQTLGANDVFYVSVVGYTASSFHLEVTWQPTDGVVQAPGDITGDGRAELLIASGQSWLVGAQGSSFAARLDDRLIGGDGALFVLRDALLWRWVNGQLMAVAQAPAARELRTLPDVTGDGLAELLALEGTTLRVLQASNGLSTVATFTGLPSDTSMTSVGELDGNPGAEVVVRSNASAVVLSLQNGTLLPSLTVPLGPLQTEATVVESSGVLARGAARDELIVQLRRTGPPL